LIVIVLAEQLILILSNERIFRVVILVLFFVKITELLGLLINLLDFFLDKFLVFECLLQVGNLPEVLFTEFEEVENTHDHVLLEEVADLGLQL
jgi:hypothetical protein